ncbi:DNA cytosine methyltransferase [Chitinimonas naiadis]
MTTAKPLRFIDVFAGCGGLSLGLLEAGCEGIFAVEKSPLAFETLRFNLVDGERHKFQWPAWLPKQAMTCEQLLEKFPEHVASLRGSVDLIVGGPPCQGFSTAGRRDPADPRNKMTEQYLSLVGLVQPRFLVIENVAGFNMRFESNASLDELIVNSKKISYAQYVTGRLIKLGYTVWQGLVNCADFGVPQTRQRHIIICEQERQGEDSVDLLSYLRNSSTEFRLSKGLPADRQITTREAISDLETKGREYCQSDDSDAKGFFEATYSKNASLSSYQKIMRGDFSSKPNSLRLARHKPETVAYFENIQRICRPGKCLSQAERQLVGTKKHTITVLDPQGPAPTITTLPDDILHYDEPRILTARENARLQSFPDWFSFQGKYTTGGKQRKLECPRYTQIGNAVPPLVGEAIGRMLRNIWSQAVLNPRDRKNSSWHQKIQNT